jgi:hypothetical protein
MSEPNLDAVLARAELIVGAKRKIENIKQLGYSCEVPAALGNLAIARGNFLRDGSRRVSVTLIERTIPSGEQVVSVVTRGSFISRRDLSLDNPNATELEDLGEFSKPQDEYLLEIITSADYNPVDSSLAASQVIANPGMFGIMIELDQ